MRTLYGEKSDIASGIVQSIVQNAISSENIKLKCAALYLIDTIASNLIQDKKLKSSVPLLLQQFIYPSMVSGNPILIFRILYKFVLL